MSQGRQKQIESLIPHLVGRSIKIFTQSSPSTYWAVATVKGFTGSYLLLENVEIWNGVKKTEDKIHAQWIRKIEYQ